MSEYNGDFDLDEALSRIHKYSSKVKFNPKTSFNDSGLLAGVPFNGIGEGVCIDHFPIYYYSETYPLQVEYNIRKACNSSNEQLENDLFGMYTTPTKVSTFDETPFTWNSSHEVVNIREEWQDKVNTSAKSFLKEFNTCEEDTFHQYLYEKHNIAEVPPLLL